MNHATAMLIQALVFALVASGCAPGPPSIRPISEPTADPASLERARQLDTIEALIEDGALADAEAQLTSAMAAGLDHPRAAFLRGRLLLAKGGDEQIVAAIPWLQRATAGSPRWPEPRLLLGVAYLELNRLASADDAYRSIDELFDHHPAGPYGRGIVALRQRRHSDAETQLTTALERDPDYPPALAAMATLAAREGDRERQRRFLGRYLALRPLDAGALTTYGNLLVDLGHLEDGRRALERAYELLPDSATAQRLADLARQRGDQDAERRWLRRSQHP